MTENVFDYSADDIGGKKIDLSEYKGKYLLIVNTASKCGFTPQYKGLEKLYQKFSGQLEVLGFPCNQFGHQEPDGEDTIQQTCELNFGVTFPLFSKIDVNGENAHPLFKHLKHQAPGILGTEKIKWNFTKFLVGPDGKVLKRFASKDTPEKISKEIDGLLNT